MFWSHSAFLRFLLDLLLFSLSLSSHSTLLTYQEHTLKKKKDKKQTPLFYQQSCDNVSSAKGGTSGLPPPQLLWVHMHNCTAMSGKHCSALVIHSLALTVVQVLLPWCWSLGRGDVIHRTHLRLSMLVPFFLQLDQLWVSVNRHLPQTEVYLLRVERYTDLQVL